MGHSTRIKGVLATVGAGALLAMGGVTAATSTLTSVAQEDEPSPPEPVTTSEVTTGETTTTTTTGNTEPETSVALPVVTAEPAPTADPFD